MVFFQCAMACSVSFDFFLLSSIHSFPKKMEEPLYSKRKRTAPLPAGQDGTRFPRISGAPVNDSVGTPIPLYDDLDAMFSFTYDPCPLNGKDDPNVPNGLEQRWGWTSFINPPYSQIVVWLAWAVYQMYTYGTRSVFLIPAHVETLYWHHYVLEHASEVWFCCTGLRFAGYAEKFSMPMCLIIFGALDDCLPLHASGTRLRLGENQWYVQLLPRGLANQQRRLDVVQIRDRLALAEGR